MHDIIIALKENKIIRSRLSFFKKYMIENAKTGMCLQSPLWQCIPHMMFFRPKPSVRGPCIVALWSLSGFHIPGMVTASPDPQVLAEMLFKGGWCICTEAISLMVLSIMGLIVLLLPSVLEEGHVWRSVNVCSSFFCPKGRRRVGWGYRQ